MRFGSAIKDAIGVAPATVNNTTVTCAIIDTQSFNFLHLPFWFGASDAAMTVLKLQESDDSGMSGATDVPGGDFTATLPGATDDNHFWTWNVQLGGARKRYMRISATVGGTTGTTGAAVCCIGSLSKYSEAPFDATTEGAKYVLNIQ